MKFSAAFLLCALPGAALLQSASTLWDQGYSVLPAPRNVKLTGGDVTITGAWSFNPASVGARHIASRSLINDFREFHGLTLSAKPGTATILLAIKAGTVRTGAEPGVDRQAYRLSISPRQIEITANGDPGLLYGVATLVQLLRSGPGGQLKVPEGVIEDWPQYELRFLHWDTKHHQDRLETLKRYLDWSARMKVNMIGFELEDKFEYPSNPIVGAPGAFTAAELQGLVDYALERYIQIVPVIQSPAHLAFVLKHPQFADLREDGNNYQIAMCDPRSYDLIFSLYDDVIKATKGVDYFFVSTDEVYYAGIGKNCAKPYTPENRSLQWVEFVQRAEKFLSQRGRRMLIWAEYPLLAQHAKLLPKGIIDGVIGNPGYLEAEKQLGIRQLAYNSMQGGELLFPNHLALEGENGITRGHLESASESILRGRHVRANPIGVFGAAWDDSGLHNETFWLGWSAIAQYAWTPGIPPVDQHVASFLRLYYGPEATGLPEIYRQMQRQARAWQNSWDRMVSKARGPGYGNSYGKGVGTTRYDMTLVPPPLPSMPALALTGSFREKYGKFIEAAKARAIENDELILMIQDNFPRVSRNRYNLEVLVSLARFMGHHWDLLLGLFDAERSLEHAAAAHTSKNPSRAVGLMVAAYNRTGQLTQDRKRIFTELTETFEKSRFPKGQSVGGRNFLHVLDDTKDHWADRRPDLTYMTAPEESMELEKWRAQLSEIIRSYAKQHNVPVRGLEAARLEE